jgi:hypothetical protein
MLDSFEDFKTAVITSLKDKVAERLSVERQRVSNNLFLSRQKEKAQETPEETQSNADDT